MSVSSLCSGENPRIRFESKEIEEIAKGKKDIFARFGLTLNERMVGIIKDSIGNQQFSGSSGDPGDYSGGGGWDVLGADAQD
ncbi:MAG: hypothetical protein K1060chlam3_00748 [Candidatus Anoxychlamydiales bacterium]|nr:hypothetical protein [Candidatus Anoxychlamydiales bacterium]